MDVYKSKNSEYYIENGELVRVYKGKKQNLGERFVYVLTKNLVSISKEHGINLNKTDTIDTLIGDKFMVALEDKDMNPNEVGGRYLVLQEGLGDYSFFCGGKIIEKKEFKPEEESELRLADDKN